MRTEQARPVRLENYRPPDWLVETVELDVSLHPTATRVRATLKMSPNPQAKAPAPIVLDGDGLTLVSLKLDGSVMPPGRLRRDAGQPHHRAAAGRHLLSADRNDRSIRPPTRS